jgi:hypothetical protein
MDLAPKEADEAYRRGDRPVAPLAATGATRTRKRGD